MLRASEAPHSLCVPGQTRIPRRQLSKYRHNAQNPKSRWSTWRVGQNWGAEVGTEYCLCLLSFEFVVPLAGKPDARCPHLRISSRSRLLTKLVQRDTSAHSVPRTHKIQR